MIVYEKMDVTLKFADMTDPVIAGYDVTNINPNAVGRIYNDPLHPATVAAAQTQIATFVCPSTPIAFGTRSPDGYGLWDYMFIAVSDLEDGSTGGTTVATTPIGTRPTVTARRTAMTIRGMLSCDKGWTIGSVRDGLSNTFLCIEDAGRSHPSAGVFGTLSTRPSPIPDQPGTPVQPIWTGTTPRPEGRRMYAWADPDSGANGLSGPSNALAPASRVAGINQNRSPVGGPTTCLWTQNNCGPNDEPFSFHAGGCNVVMGDGAVRFMNESTDAMILKWLTGSQEGVIVNLE
jgi:prepilin-type processing-associated H-X9-DG protein